MSSLMERSNNIFNYGHFVSFTLNENIQIEKFKRYYKPSQLSVFTSKLTTNNGAESYHAKISNIFKCNHPNIWIFCETLNNIIIDTDAEIGRLDNGLDISRRQRKTKLEKMN